MDTKPSDRSKQIIEEATRLFGQDGYKKVTIKQLAAACGITDAALYRHFRSKEAIYAEVLKSVEARLVDQEVLDRIAEEKNIEVLLKRLAEHIIEFFGRNPDLYRLLLYSALEGHERASQVFGMIRGRYIRYLVEQLDRLFDAGEIVEKNSEITARCFIGMVFDCALGFSLWKGMQGKGYKASEVVANNIPIYVNGLKKR
jgi:AcrR family transcriptional regulator